MTKHDETGNQPTANELHDHDRGLAFDLSTLIDRRQMFRLAAGASVLSFTAIACGGGTLSPAATPESATGGSGTTATDASTTNCAAIPEETAGPYPGDGSNGVNVLAETGIVRDDIRPSFGDATGVADGVPLRIDLVVTDDANGCAPLAGAAVYLWHCDRDGLYSLYSEGAAAENYLRGVQETDASGTASFTSIFPGCYTGRWPHVHFEVYSSVEGATTGDAPIVTSQLAFPGDTCDVVYETAGYDQSITNLSQTSLESDNVFADGHDLQLATVTGSVEEGFVATLTVGT